MNNCTLHLQCLKKWNYTTPNVRWQSDLLLTSLIIFSLLFSPCSTTGACELEWKHTRLIFGENTKARTAAFGKLPEMKFNVQDKQSLLLGIIYKPHPVGHKKGKQNANKLPARMACTVGALLVRNLKVSITQPWGSPQIFPHHTGQFWHKRLLIL